MKDQIAAVLKEMDPLDDDQWTGNGDPKVDYIKEKTGLEEVTRHMIFEADPSFNRKKAAEPEQEQKPEVTDPEEDEQENASVEHLSNLDEPMTEKQFAIFLRDVPAEDLRDVELLLKNQQIDISRQANYLVDLKFRVKRAVGFVRSRIKREVPDSSNQEAIRDYLESQKRQRADRAAKRDEVFGQFGNLNDINPRSQLDQAMARKTKRGTKRPERNLLK